MRVVRKTFPFLALSILLLGGLGCATGSAHLRPWLEVRTTNFTILTPHGEGEALELARSLELFRSVTEVTTGTTVRERVPLRVYALDRGTYRGFALRNASGYFLNSPRQSTIVMGDPRADEADVLRHEYAHFVIHNEGRFAYPPWYDEGFAEFLSNVEVGADSIDIGRAQRQRIQSLGRTGWIPVGEVMARRNLQGMSRRDVSSFYSISWALVHYLSVGREQKGTQHDLATYLRALRRGVGNDEAVLRGFGIDTESLDRALRRYVENGRYTYYSAPLDLFDPGEEPRLRPLSSSEAAVALGDLSAQTQRYGRARAYYHAALGLAPGNPRAMAGLADALAREGDWQTAAGWYDRALAAGADDAIVQLEYAKYRHALARGARDPDRRVDEVQAARRHYARSQALDPALPEAFEGHGSTFLLEGQDPRGGLEFLEEAHRMLPSSIEIKISLARLYARLGQKERARDLALVASMWNHAPELDEELAALLQQ